MPSQSPNPRIGGINSPSREPGKERLALYLFFCRTWRLSLPKGGKTKATFGWDNEHQGATGSPRKEVYDRPVRALQSTSMKGVDKELRPNTPYAEISLSHPWSQGDNHERLNGKPMGGSRSMHRHMDYFFGNISYYHLYEQFQTKQDR